MRRDTIPVLLLAAALGLPGTAASETSALSFSLTYLDRSKIEDDEEGLTEPSGLALSQEGDALWTVSDDTKKIFKLSLDGKLAKDESFKVGEKGLEGIALDPTGGSLLVVKEESNEILTISIASEDVVSRHSLSDMAGFGEIAQHFSGGGANKGLEGITFNQDTGTVFVLKEGEPGLLIEISKDLGEIVRARILDATNGFIDDDVDGAEIDFSGIHYDDTRSLFWIVSDKARRLFLYDWDQNQMIQSAALGFEKDGEFQEIEKAEGVAADPQSNGLYVVSDNEARLYVFDIR
jgi:uncharacterized protein YjiK